MLWRHCFACSFEGEASPDDEGSRIRTGDAKRIETNSPMAMQWQISRVVIAMKIVLLLQFQIALCNGGKVDGMEAR